MTGHIDDVPRSNDIQRRKIGFGWIPDLPDHLDYKYSLIAPALAADELPLSISLQDGHMPAVYDQGQLGSCTAQAIAASFTYLLSLEKLKVFNPSRLFIYFNERLIEGTVHSDAGAMIRDGMKVLGSYGACDERTWPYAPAKYDLVPSRTAYLAAKQEHHHAIQYNRVDRDLTQFKLALCSRQPIVIGFSVYQNFMTNPHNWVVPNLMPMPSGRQAGGHAVLVCGYDDSKLAFLVRNSWGAGWGDAGYFWMPYEYIMNEGLSDDFWTITKA